MPSHEFYQDSILRAITTCNSELLEEAVFNCEVRLLEESAFPAELFDSVISMMQSPECLAMPGSWKLVRIFENNWHLLFEEQRSHLLEVLDKTFSRFGDWMSCFVISGILGECYMDRRAVDVLVRLKQWAPDVARSLVPHGFEHIVAGCKDNDVVEDALKELFEMQKDSSEAVRREVDISLQRLKRVRT
jgi:hypothetical protein